MFTRYMPILLVTMLLAGVSNAAEEESTDWNTTTLTGDWGGARTNLYSKGVSLAFSHKSDVLANLSGGIRRGTGWLGHTEAGIEMDMEKLLDWDDTTAYIHYHSQLGSKFNTHYVGAFVGVDNIEAGTNTAQLYHAWVQKNFSENSLSVLAGLYPVDSEFYVTDTSGVFIQPPYGMANDMAQTGQNGPPVFPLGALAVRVKYTTPGKNYYLQGALTDGVPGDPDNPHGTHIKLGNGDGPLSIVELGYIPSPEEEGYFNKTAIGWWRYSAQANDLVDTDAFGNPLSRYDQGFYFLAERTLYSGQNDPVQGLSGFIRFGTVNRDIHQSDWTGSLGLRSQGLFAGRDDDIAGIAVTFNHASEKYRLLNNADSGETNVEITYRAQLKPWLALQPTLQYFRNLNMDPVQKDAWVMGVRVEIDF
ncbi:MAG: carbohydrate porin [Sideroxyarcus sp.]|nr:carbohydrate porin [Sideroxyarcus sp.]